MTDNEQKVLERLLEQSDEFRGLYDRHNELKARVRDAELRHVPMDSMRPRRTQARKAPHQGSDGHVDRRARRRASGIECLNFYIRATDTFASARRA